MEKLYQAMPGFVQDIFVTVFNVLAYRKRYSGNYRRYLEMFKNNRTLSRADLEVIQKRRFRELVENSVNQSDFYREFYQDVADPGNIAELNNLPILTKEKLRQNLDRIRTVSKSEGVVSKTGGTTGKSIEVVFTRDNMQERFAMLDYFRSQSGYELGKKTAWFSGKNILTEKDVSKRRFWKTDWYYNVRYYSTFHIKTDYLIHYLENLIHYKPEYITGFPSSVYEVAKFGLSSGVVYPKGVLKAIFSTSETVTPEIRSAIESFFGVPLYNQYASSEGAPIIYECPSRNLHMDLQSGVFEVLDDDGKNAPSGKLVLTSFTTAGTPLIRYDIGDSITIREGVCPCGNENPMIAEILGRIDDFVYSPVNGKINLVNVANTLKDTYGIVRFQAIQDSLDSLRLLIVTDPKLYTSTVQETFIKNWKDRMGTDFNIAIEIVDDIPNEASGKFRVVKNNIKHLLS